MANAPTGTLQRPVRRFRFGVTVLEDLDATKSPQDVLLMYVPNYPFLANALVGEPVLENDALVFPVQKPAVQTKGARKEPSTPGIEDCVSDIRAWAGAEPELTVSQVWQDIASIADRVLKRPVTLDAAYLPLV